MDISINGPRIIFTIPIFGGIPVTETITNFWWIMIAILIFSLVITRNLKKFPGKFQIVLEKGITVFDNLVEQTMGKDKMVFAPYMFTLFIAALLSNLCSLLGMRSPTVDYNTTLGWALVTFCMIQFNSVRTKGFLGYLKGFTEPITVITPLNVISEIATPISMSFRLFGNMVAGLVISTLVYGALGAATAAIFGGLQIPILAIGLPAILSIYFDLFTSCIQAFIFTMLTMVFVSNAIN